MIRDREKNIYSLGFNFKYNKNKKNENNMSKIIASTFNKKIIY